VSGWQLRPLSPQLPSLHVLKLLGAIARLDSVNGATQAQLRRGPRVDFGADEGEIGDDQVRRAIDCRTEARVNARARALCVGVLACWRGVAHLLRPRCNGRVE
jgi:hypothetical protein